MFTHFLSLYYPDNVQLYNIYAKVKDLFYDEFLNYAESTQEREESIYSTFSLLKTIEAIIGEFEDNKYIIEKIYKKEYADNFLIIHGWNINNLKSYYKYFYINELYNDHHNNNLNFVFMY